MSKHRSHHGFITCFVSLSALCTQLAAAQQTDLRETGGVGQLDLSAGGYSLTLKSETEYFDAAMATKIVDTFFQVYPQECDTFNSSCAKAVTIRIAPTEIQCGKSAAPACTIGSEIALAGDVLWYNVEDYDMVTHEAMHVVQQGYVSDESCWYWDEGLADVARSRFGVNNAAAQWSFDYVPGQTYTDGYVATAHFLEWIKDTYQYDVSVNLDSALRSIGCPDDTFWEKQTKLGLAALWNQYLLQFDPEKAFVPTASSTATATIPTEPEGENP